MENFNNIIDSNCLSLLDEIYFLQCEHRTIFSDLVDKGYCYLNKEMLGYNLIISNLNKDLYKVIDVFEKDDLFNYHRQALKASKPSISEHTWQKVILR